MREVLSFLKQIVLILENIAKIIIFNFKKIIGKYGRARMDICLDEDFKICFT